MMLLSIKHIFENYLQLPKLYHTSASPCALQLMQTSLLASNFCNFYWQFPEDNYCSTIAGSSHNISYNNKRYNHKILKTKEQEYNELLFAIFCCFYAILMLVLLNFR